MIRSCGTAVCAQLLLGKNVDRSTVVLHVKISMLSIYRNSCLLAVLNMGSYDYHFMLAYDVCALPTGCDEIYRPIIAD